MGESFSSGIFGDDIGRRDGFVSSFLYANQFRDIQGLVGMMISSIKLEESSLENHMEIKEDSLDHRLVVQTSEMISLQIEQWTGEHLVEITNKNHRRTFSKMYSKINRLNLHSLSTKLSIH